MLMDRTGHFRERRARNYTARNYTAHYSAMMLRLVAAFGMFFSALLAAAHHHGVPLTDEGEIYEGRLLSGLYDRPDHDNARELHSAHASGAHSSHAHAAHARGSHSSHGSHAPVHEGHARDAYWHLKDAHLGDVHLGEACLICAAQSSHSGKLAAAASFLIRLYALAAGEAATTVLNTPRPFSLGRAPARAPPLSLR